MPGSLAPSGGLQIETSYSGYQYLVIQRGYLYD